MILIFDSYLFLSNSSISGILLAVIMAFILGFLKSNYSFYNLIILLLIAILFFALISSKSRSGWIGLLVALIYLVHQKFISINYRKLFLVSSSVVLFFLFVFLLFYKIDSSSGRSHIYSLSFKMIRSNPFFGIGLGKFKGAFNDLQADFFSHNNINGRRALLADNTFYAFNDYLQWMIETGLIGLLVMISVFLFVIKRIILLHQRSAKPIIFSATAALICIAVAGLFSYPFQIIPLQFVTLVCINIIAFYPIRLSSLDLKQKKIGFIFRVLVLMIVTIFILSVFQNQQRKKLEKEAFELAQLGYKRKAIDKYEVLIAKYPSTGYNFYSYAQLLYYSNQLRKSLNTLKEGSKYYLDNKVCKLKAEVEYELGLINEAENSYLKAVYMVPNRMENRIDLLNFYIQQKDSSQIIFWANSILEMPVKISSQSTENMLAFAKTTVTKFNK